MLVRKIVVFKTLLLSVPAASITAWRFEPLPETSTAIFTVIEAFRLKQCYIRVLEQPLRRLITPIGFGDKVLKFKRFLGFSVKPFLKRVAGKHILKRVAGKQFFEKVWDAGGENLAFTFLREFLYVPL